MTTEYIMIDCPHCEGRGTLAQLDVDIFVGCPACHATGELEVEEEALPPQDCPECLGPCEVLDSLGTCGSERCRRQTLLAQDQEYGGTDPKWINGMADAEDGCYVGCGDYGVECWPCNDCGALTPKFTELCGPCYEEERRREEREAMHPELRCPPRE